MISRPEFDAMSAEQKNSYFREYIKSHPGGRYRPNLSADIVRENQGAVGSHQAPNVDVDMSGVGPIASMLGSYAGVDPTFTSAATAVMSGMSPEQLSSLAGRSMAGYGVNKVTNTLAANIPGVGPMVSALTSTAMSENHNYAKTAIQSGIQTAAGVAGSVFGGPLGALAATSLTDYMTRSSWEYGTLGDITNSRKREKELDRVEDTGVSMAETAAMASEDAAYGEFGLSSMGGLTETAKATPYGRLDSVVDREAFLPATSLSDFFDSINKTAEQAAQTEVPDSFDLSTTQGALAYGEAHNLRITDLDTAMSEARSHAGLDTIGTGVELSEKENTEYGRFDSDKDNDDSGGAENDGAGGQTGGDKDGGRY